VTEVLSTDTELRWPMALAPFSCAVLAPKPNSKEDGESGAGRRAAADFAAHLNTHVFVDDVVLDDRDRMTVGRKLREATKTGYPFIVLFGKATVNKSEPLLEIHELLPKGDSEETQMQTLSPAAVIDYLKSKQTQQVVKHSYISTHNHMLYS